MQEREVWLMIEKPTCLLCIITKLSLVLYHLTPGSQKPYEIFWCLATYFPRSCLWIANKLDGTRNNTLTLEEEAAFPYRCSQNSQYWEAGNTHHTPKQLVSKLILHCKYIQHQVKGDVLIPLKGEQQAKGSLSWNTATVGLASPTFHIYRCRRSG